MAETNTDEVVVAFLKHYYSTFDTNRPGMAQLYRENSMMTFEGQKFKGLQNIVNMFNSLPLPVCHHDISTVDCQPYGPPGGMLAFVTGTLNVPGQEHPLKYSEIFNLIPIQDTFYVLNAILRSNKA
ncbi:hypothetical protein Vadar_006930 [Vaccinium darrowii]|uniref:Uncharacterized protein n=1 Tax=Vaccinium darrowii TaxID=229202 RepID=A0ACB7WYK5_9ERIC|nr:hypothetical protein Vadar_006930 [Vaccinium darrowii]